jgi:hypothetical protein
MQKLRQLLKINSLNSKVFDVLIWQWNPAGAVPNTSPGVLPDFLFSATVLLKRQCVADGHYFDKFTISHSESQSNIEQYKNMPAILKSGCCFCSSDTNKLRPGT